MTRYRADIFDKDFNFISYSTIADKTIQVDYLVNDVSTVVLPQIVEAYVSNYIAIRQNGTIYIQGIISDVAYDQGKTTISFVGFNSLLDVDIMEDPRVFDSTPVEEWLSDRLEGLFNGSDTFQNLTGFSAVYTTSTVVPMDYDRSDVELEEINLFDFIQGLLTKHDIILKWNIDFSHQRVVCRIEKLNLQSQLKVKLGLADTPEYTIDIHRIEGEYNKIKYYNDDNFSDTVTYYLHSDGTIDTDGTTDRLTPVHYIEKTAKADSSSGTTFQQEALSDAESTMLNSNFDHEIIVTFNTDSKILTMGEIGQLYSLITPEGVVYSSILTGYEQINAKFLKLVFGYIRTNFTTILKMQRRKN